MVLGIGHGFTMGNSGLLVKGGVTVLGNACGVTMGHSGLY